MKICYLLIFALLFCIPTTSYAQIEEDERLEILSKISEHKDSDDNEALFNELFSEFTPDERDITNPAEFNDAINEAANIVRSYSNFVTKQEEAKAQINEKLLPLEGDIHLSIVSDSFKIFKNIAGRQQCRFSVKLKSNIDRDIDVIGLSLAYPKMSFAFIFREVPPMGELVKNITTRGDICYDLSGAPDIHVNKCRIKNTDGKDCVSHIKWFDGK